jgi:polyphosphate kinase 2 (PPK2 family)
LLIFQGMDAAGKDGTIQHVMSGVNPQGVQVWSFKAPSAEELHHGYLWRCMKCAPGRGQIGIFNRSYYEEVLVVRVHPQILESQKLPKELVTRHIWQERFEDINNFERYATRNGIGVVKFFLHLSKGRTEAPVHGTARPAGQKLEVFFVRREGTRILGRLSASVRGYDSAHGK